MDMASAIVEMLGTIPNPTITGTSLYAKDKHEGTYCCLTCRKEMNRIHFPLMKRYVMPAACKCDIARIEREEEERERKLRRAMLEKTYKRSIMNERLKTASFDNFELRRGTELCFTESRNFAEQFENRTDGLLMFGKPGNGKSHLL